MGLDKFGFPAAALANEILIKQKTFGDNARDLEESWFEWLHYNPFDFAVAQKLAQLYNNRIESIDPDEDSRRLLQLERKLALVEKHLQRYGQESLLEQ